jgi:hypothetical protein
LKDEWLPSKDGKCSSTLCFIEYTPGEPRVVVKKYDENQEEEKKDVPSERCDLQVYLLNLVAVDGEERDKQKYEYVRLYINAAVLKVFIYNQ